MSLVISMARIRSYFHKRRKDEFTYLTPIRHRYHKGKPQPRLHKIIGRWHKAFTLISICLVENSKQHRSDKQTIEDIREIMGKYFE